VAAPRRPSPASSHGVAPSLRAARRSTVVSDGDGDGDVDDYSDDGGGGGDGDDARRGAPHITMG